MLLVLEWVVSVMNKYDASPLLSGEVPSVVGLGKEGEKSSRVADTPVLSSPNFKLYFYSLVLEPDTNKTQGVLSEEQVPLSTWPKSLL